LAFYFHILTASNVRYWNKRQHGPEQRLDVETVAEQDQLRGVYVSSTENSSKLYSDIYFHAVLTVTKISAVRV